MSHVEFFSKYLRLLEDRSKNTIDFIILDKNSGTTEILANRYVNISKTI